MLAVSNSQQWQPGDVAIDSKGRLFLRGSDAPWRYLLPSGFAPENTPTEPVTLLARDNKPAPQ